MRKLLCMLSCAMAMLLLGCGSAAQPEPKARVVHVAAAASLEQVLEQQLIPLFYKKYPDVKIQGVYDASGKLQNQIENGLKADIFISAAPQQLQALAAKGYVDAASIRPLLENKLVLIVPAQAGNNAGIQSFADIAKAKQPAIGDPASVPAGQYAQEALTSLGIWQEVQSRASLGTNVTQVLSWVSEGSADAGLVYATDAALRSDKVRIIAEAPAASLRKQIIYPIGLLKQAPEPVAAQKLVDFLQTDEAMRIFAQYGFARAKDKK